MERNYVLVHIKLLVLVYAYGYVKPVNVIKRYDHSVGIK